MSKQDEDSTSRIESQHHVISDRPALVRHGFGARCRWCGAGHEGTAGYTIDHWKRCTGVATYFRAIAFDVPPAVAMKLATWVYRDFPTDLDAVHAWEERDYATRFGLVEGDGSQ